jgi:hypothetical protein
LGNATLLLIISLQRRGLFCVPRKKKPVRHDPFPRFCHSIAARIIIAIAIQAVMGSKKRTLDNDITRAINIAKDWKD